MPLYIGDRLRLILTKSEWISQRALGPEISSPVLFKCNTNTIQIQYKYNTNTIQTYFNTSHIVSRNPVTFHMTMCTRDRLRLI